MAAFFAMLSVAATLASVGVLPRGVDIGESQHRTQSNLLGVSPGPDGPKGSFSLKAEFEVGPAHCLVSVYGRDDKVTDIGMTNSRDDKGEFFALLSSKITAALGPANIVESGNKTWRRGSETILLYRRLDSITQLSITSPDSVWRLD